MVVAQWVGRGRWIDTVKNCLEIRKQWAPPIGKGTKIWFRSICRECCLWLCIVCIKYSDLLQSITWLAVHAIPYRHGARALFIESEERFGYQASKENGPG